MWVGVWYGWVGERVSMGGVSGGRKDDLGRGVSWWKGGDERRGHEWGRRGGCYRGRWLSTDMTSELSVVMATVHTYTCAILLIRLERSFVRSTPYTSYYHGSTDIVKCLSLFESTKVVPFVSEPCRVYVWISVCVCVVYTREYRNEEGTSRKREIFRWYDGLEPRLKKKKKPPDLVPKIYKSFGTKIRRQGTFFKYFTN